MKNWGFDYITLKSMQKENPDYDPESGRPPEMPDYETFYSKSSDFLEACKEFDEFERENELWDVDPEASYNFGEVYRDIVGVVNYNRF